MQRSARIMKALNMSWEDMVEEKGMKMDSFLWTSAPFMIWSLVEQYFHTRIVIK